jgi:hypothetical protein
MYFHQTGMVKHKNNIVKQRMKRSILYFVRSWTKKRKRTACLTGMFCLRCQAIYSSSQIGTTEWNLSSLFLQFGYGLDQSSNTDKMVRLIRHKFQTGSDFHLSNGYRGFPSEEIRERLIADHSLPSSAEVKNVWKYTSTPHTSARSSA